MGRSATLDKAIADCGMENHRDTYEAIMGHFAKIENESVGLMELLFSVATQAISSRDVHRDAIKANGLPGSARTTATRIRELVEMGLLESTGDGRPCRLSQLGQSVAFDARIKSVQVSESN